MKNNNVMNICIVQ